MKDGAGSRSRGPRGVHSLHIHKQARGPRAYINSKEEPASAEKAAASWHLSRPLHWSAGNKGRRERTSYSLLPAAERLSLQGVFPCALQVVPPKKRRSRAAVRERGRKRPPVAEEDRSPSCRAEKGKVYNTHASSLIRERCTACTAAAAAAATARDVV